VLQAYQPELLARPADWGAHVHVVGLCAGGMGPLPEADAGGSCLPEAVRTFFGADTSTPVVLLALGAIGDEWSDAAGRTNLLTQCLEAFTAVKVRGTCAPAMRTTKHAAMHTTKHAAPALRPPVESRARSPSESPRRRVCQCRAIVVAPASARMPGEFTVDGYRVSPHHPLSGRRML